MGAYEIRTDERHGGVSLGVFEGLSHREAMRVWSWIGCAIVWFGADASWLRVRETPTAAQLQRLRTEATRRGDDALAARCVAAREDPAVRWGLACVWLAWLGRRPVASARWTRAPTGPPARAPPWGEGSAVGTSAKPTGFVNACGQVGTSLSRSRWQLSKATSRMQAKLS
jgi:hypothetical protein